MISKLNLKLNMKLKNAFRRAEMQSNLKSTGTQAKKEYAKPRKKCEVRGKIVGNDENNIQEYWMCNWWSWILHKHEDTWFR